jgi:hypothetical protein
MKKIIFVFLVSSVIFGCKNQDDDMPVPDLWDVRLRFDAQFDGQPIAFGGTYYQLASGEEMRFSRFKFLLSGIKFTSEQGDANPRIPYAYIDVQGNELEALLQFPKSNVNFTGFQFDIGVDSAANHADPNLVPAGHPLDPVRNQLHWGWADGYVYLLLEGFKRHPVEDIPVIFHVGIFPDLTTLEFPLSNSGLMPQDLNFVVHVDRIFSTPNIYSIQENGSFTHSQEDGGVAAFLYRNFSHAFELLP